MMKTSILAETDPDLAQAGAALERAARDARRLADQTDTPFIVFIDGKIVDLRKIEQESQVAPMVNEPSEPYPTR
jgi:pyruvate/2-oxoacid:ferredoxin oxidoreductase alpha subunit